jgi:hypothetical protein
MEKGRSSSQ